MLSREEEKKRDEERGGNNAIYFKNKIMLNKSPAIYLLSNGG